MRSSEEILELFATFGPEGREAFDDDDSLNPQPLPPVQEGFRNGRVLVQTALLAQRLGLLTWEPGDDICPPVKRPKGFPGPRRDIDDVAGYAAGLAASLLLSRGQWAHLDIAPTLLKLGEKAAKVAAS